MTGPSDDQWSASNFGDDVSRVLDPNDKSPGGQLRLLCSGNLELAKKSGLNNELIDELKLWEKQFPTLQVTGVKIPVKHIPYPEDESLLTTRMIVARRIVLNYILPDVSFTLLLYFNTSSSASTLITNRPELLEKAPNY